MELVINGGKIKVAFLYEGFKGTVKKEPTFEEGSSCYIFINFLGSPSFFKLYFCFT